MKYVRYSILFFLFIWVVSFASCGIDESGALSLNPIAIPSQTISRSDFVEIQLNPKADGKDGVEVIIDVTNKSRFTIKLLRVEFYLLDKSDKQLASGIATFTDILPESSNLRQDIWIFSSAKDRNRDRNTMQLIEIDNWRFKPQQFVIKSLNNGEDIDGSPYLQLRSKKRFCQPGITFVCTRKE